MIAQALILLLVANGSPLLLRLTLRGRGDWALDAGVHLRDGRLLFGATKSWRGVAVALGASSAVSALLGTGWLVGAGVGALAMLGDLCSSFVKRRLRLASGERALGLDQLPESLLPLVVYRETLALTPADIVVVAFAFLATDLLLSRLLVWLGVRAHPF